MKNRILTFVIILAIMFSAIDVQPVMATGATQFKITVVRMLNGVNSEVTVFENGSWTSNRTVYFDTGNAPAIKLWALNGTTPYSFEVNGDNGWDDYYSGTTNPKAFYPYPPEGDYAAWIDGIWVGGTGAEFYLRARYPDLIASQPKAENGAATPPFCQNQVINWWTTITNQGATISDSTYVGYYIGTSSTDYSNRWGSDSTGTLAIGASSTEYDDYTFTASDVGSRYINVMADYDLDQDESNENNNKNSYGPFQVLATPDAQFIADKTSGSYPLTIQFTSQSTGSPTSYLWNFGTGATSTAQNPSYTYTQAGDFTVSLTVSGTCGTDIETKTAYIHVTDPPPTANFTANPTSGVKPLTVNFTDLSTGVITSRDWNFGDDQTSTLQNPSHSYTNAGTYTVTLTVTGPGGSDAETKTNYITVSETPPVAQFSANLTSGNKPLEVHFDSTTSTGVISSWAWNFGDGESSTLQNPVHTYNLAGDFTVSLTVTGPGGSDVETKNSYIHVSEIPPVADFSVDTQSGDKPLTVNFTNLSVGNIISYDWDFGDGNHSALVNPQYTYTTAGVYTVSLTATGPGGSDEEIKADYITVIGVDLPVISNIKITNVRDSAFSISWTQDIPTGTEIHWGTTTSLGNTAYDDRGSGVVDDVHHITIQGLSQLTDYYFEIVAGGTINDNNGNKFYITTGPTLGLPSSDTIYGRIFLSDGTTPAPGTLVYVVLTNIDGAGSSGNSAEISTITDSNGYWFVNLGNVRVIDLTAYFLYSASGDRVSVYAQGGGAGVASISVDTSADFPVNNLILGTPPVFYNLFLPLLRR